jgi:uncharacterized membrane protein
VNGMTGESSVPGNDGGRMSRLIDGLKEVAAAAGERALSVAGDRIAAATERFVEYAARGGGPGVAAAAAGARQAAAGRSPTTVAVRAGLAGVAAKVRQAVGGGRGKEHTKATNIVEAIDVGVPARLAYNQWTQFTQWPAFTKKVESVEQDGDEKLTWKAQIFWSHRTWESTIVEQMPDRRIVWRSTGAKGSVDGSVSFHELGPELTRILLVLEYHPQGLFERTGNLWRAQGRRARLELKHFARHVATQSVLRPDEVEGWRGEIHDGRVVRDHQTAIAQGRGGSAPERGPKPRPEPDPKPGPRPARDRTPEPDEPVARPSTRRRQPPKGDRR